MRKRIGKTEYRCTEERKKKKRKKKRKIKKEERKKEKKRRKRKRKKEIQHGLSTCCPVQPHLHRMLFRNLPCLEVESLTGVGSLPASAA